MKKIILFAAIVLLIGACQNNETKTTSNKDTATAVVQNPSVATGDNSMTALDWAGTYKGTVPCADCEGIETCVVRCFVMIEGGK